jgi:hypothetical protein
MIIYWLLPSGLKIASRLGSFALETTTRRIDTRKQMKLPKHILLITFAWLALASGGAQAVTVCTVAATCKYADLVDGAISVSAVGASVNGVLGEPVDANEGVHLAPMAGDSPNNGSVLTLRLSDFIENELWIYSFDTTSEMRFELFVSELGTDFDQVETSLLSVGDREFFENDNAMIDISGYGIVQYVQLVSFSPDTICGDPLFSPNPPNCKIYGTAMEVNGAGGTLASTSAVPVPAAAWLFGSGLLGLVGVARRRRK